VQLSDRALVPIEQFGLGGLESVRGYRQDLLLTDNGALLLRRCGYRFCVSQLDGVLQVAPLLMSPPGTAPVELIQTVTPWRLSVCGKTGSLTARLDWGIPLVDVDSRRRKNMAKTAFSVIYNPFKDVALT